MCPAHSTCRRLRFRYQQARAEAVGDMTELDAHASALLTLLKTIELDGEELQRDLALWYVHSCPLFFTLLFLFFLKINMRLSE